MANTDWITQRLAQLGEESNAARAKTQPLDVGQFRVGGRIYDMYNDADVDALTAYIDALPRAEDGSRTLDPADYDSVNSALTFIDGTPDVPSANRSVVQANQSWMDKARNFGSDFVDSMASATHRGMRALNTEETYTNPKKTAQTLINSGAKNVGVLGDLVQGALGYGVSKMAYGGDGRVPQALEFDTGLQDRLDAMFPAPKKADENLQEAADFYFDPLAFAPELKAVGGLTRAAVKDAAQVGKVALKSPRQAAEMLGDRWIEGNKVFDATQGLVEQTLGVPEGVLPRGNTAGRSNILYPIFDNQSNTTAPWMKDLVEETRKLRESGVSAEDAYRQTRTVLGSDAPDGITRVELDDSQMVLDTPRMKSMVMNESAPLSEIINHPELQKYDFHKKGDINEDETKFYSKIKVPKGVTGGVNADANIMFATGLYGEKGRKGTILHELQHKIDQNKKIPVSGSNSDKATQAAKAEKLNAIAYAVQNSDEARQINAQMDALNNKKTPWSEQDHEEYLRLLSAQARISDKAIDAVRDAKFNINADTANMLYLANRGEANARLVDFRKDLTLAQRKNQYPYDPEYYKSVTGFYPDELWGAKVKKGADMAREQYDLAVRFPETFGEKGYQQNDYFSPEYNAGLAEHRSKFPSVEQLMSILENHKDWNSIKKKALNKEGVLDLHAFRKNYTKIMSEHPDLSSKINRASFESRINFDKEAESFSTLRNKDK